MGKFSVESGVLPIAAKTLLIEMDSAAYRALLAKTLKLGKFEFLDAWTEKDSTFVKLVTSPELGNWVPKGVRKLVESRGIEFVDIREYNPSMLASPPYRIPVDCIPSFFQDRVEVRAVMSILHLGDNHCKQVLEGTINVRVLGMGRILENIIQESLRRTYEVLPQVVERWVRVRSELLSEPGGASSLLEGRPEELQQWLSHEDELKKVLQSPYSALEPATLAVYSPHAAAAAAGAAMMPAVDENYPVAPLYNAGTLSDGYQDVPVMQLPDGHRHPASLGRPRSSTGSLQDLFSPRTIASAAQHDGILSDDFSEDYNSCDEGDTIMGSGFATPATIRTPGFMSPNGYLSPDATSVHDVALMSPQQFDDALSDAVLDLSSPTAAGSEQHEVLSKRGGHLLAARQSSDHLEPAEASTPRRAADQQWLPPNKWQNFNNDFQQWTQVWDNLHVAEMAMPAVPLPVDPRRSSRTRRRSRSALSGTPFRAGEQSSLASTLCALCCIGTDPSIYDEPPLPSPWPLQQLSNPSSRYTPPTQQSLVELQRREASGQLPASFSSGPVASHSAPHNGATAGMILSSFLETQASSQSLSSAAIGGWTADAQRGHVKVESSVNSATGVESSQSSGAAVVQVQHSGENGRATQTGSSSSTFYGLASFGAVVNSFFPPRESSRSAPITSNHTTATPAATSSWSQPYVEVLDHIQHADVDHAHDVSDIEETSHVQSLLLSPVGPPTIKVIEDVVESPTKLKTSEAYGTPKTAAWLSRKSSGPRGDAPQQQYEAAGQLTGGEDTKPGKLSGIFGMVARAVSKSRSGDDGEEWDEEASMGDEDKGHSQHLVEPPQAALKQGSSFLSWLPSWSSRQESTYSQQSSEDRE